MHSRIYSIANHLLNNLAIRKKLTILYTLTFLIPVAAVSIIAAAWIYNTLLNWETVQAESSIQQTEALFSDMLISISDLSDRLYLNEQIQHILLKQYADAREVYDDYMKITFIDDFLRAYREIAGIRFYVPNSTLLNNSHFNMTTPDIENSTWYKEAVEMQGRLLWMIKKDTITGRDYLSLVRSVWRLTDRKFVGVLSINIDTVWISRMLSTKPYETLIGLNGFFFCSSERSFTPERLSFFDEKNLTQTGSFIFRNIRWNNTANAVFIKTFLPIRGAIVHFNIVHIIPMKRLMSAALTTILFFTLTLAAVCGMSLFFISVFSLYFNKRVRLVLSGIHEVVRQNFEITPDIGGTDEFAQIYEALFETTQNIKTLITEVYQRKVESEQLISRQNDIRFKMLSSQINPHFLFNTLETIRMQALSNKDKGTAQTIKLLANILRHNLTVLDRPVPLLSELEVISNYLDIQHIRFADRINYDIVCMCSAHEIGILPLLIQPIVENSFIHGLESRLEGGFIYIEINAEDTETQQQNLVIRIKDNGEGIPPEKLKELRRKLEQSSVETMSTSIGMVNVHQRIKLYYGAQYGIEISEPNTSNTQGTMIIIRIPLITLQKKD